jgi:hypothetical protein
MFVLLLDAHEKNGQVKHFMRYARLVNKSRAITLAKQNKSKSIPPGAQHHMLSNIYRSNTLSINF